MLGCVSAASVLLVLRAPQANYSSVLWCFGKHWFASAKSQIATVFEPEVSTLRNRDGSFFDNLMRLFSEARQEHPADDCDLAFVPREHLVNGCGQTSSERTRLLLTNSAMVHPFQEIVGDLFADRYDPLCADFLALNVVETDAKILHPQPMLAALKFFQQCLRDNGSNRAC